MANPFDYVNSYGSPPMTLSDPLADTDTEMVLTALPIGWPGLGAGKKLPAFIIASDYSDPFELVHITDVTGTTCQIDRAVEGSPGGALDHAAGAYVFLPETRAAMLALSDWFSLTNVPAEFPPEDHAHTATGDGGTVSYDDLTDTPTGLPPTGSAGGELAGTYPNPTVTATHSGSAHHSNVNDPSSGEKAALAGTSGTPGSGNKYVTDGDSRNSDSRAPTGSAGGELAGTYPNPTVASVHSGSAHHSSANDPSSGEKAALAGTSGTPGSGNKYVTDGDSRNSDARTPTSHATSHENGGSDVVNPTEAEIVLADVTTLNVNTSRHGFAPKAPNDATQYLDGTGAWSTPAGTGGRSSHYEIVVDGGSPPTMVTNPADDDFLYGLVS